VSANHSISSESVGAPAETPSLPSPRSRAARTSAAADLPRQRRTVDNRHAVELARQLLGVDLAQPRRQVAGKEYEVIAHATSLGAGLPII
jgi:hypothetical protein